MKRSLIVFLIFLAVSQCVMAQSGQRFLSRVFQDISVETEIPFCTALEVGSEDEETLYFDFYEPVGDTMAYRPMVITVFGGAFVAGNRSWVDMVAFADSLSHYGYVVASIDYRLLSAWRISETNFIRNAYAAAQDLSAAIRFFKGNAETYRIDTSQIFVLGNSAGTIASMHTIWMDVNERPVETYEDEGLLGIGGHCDLGEIHSTGDPQYLSYSPAIAGLIAQWGGVLDTNIINSDDQTPVCLIHGTADETVSFYSAAPYEGHLGVTSLILPDMYGSYYLDLRLTSHNIEHEMHVFEGEEHCFYLDGLSTLIPEKLDTCFRIALKFMARYNHYLIQPTALNEQSVAHFSVSPNPTTDVIHLSGLEPETSFHCRIFDAQARCILQSENETSLNISHLLKGIYFLQVRTKADTFVRKIIKQ